jgi:hypothetical protein
MRKIVGYDLKEDDYIGFKSIAEASRWIVSHNKSPNEKAAYTTIYRCCNKIHHTAYGYIWDYDEVA